MIGIYIITNKINNKCYIGQSEDIKKRWREHKRHFKLKKNNNIVLYKAFRKYGLKNFKFDVIKECTIDELSELEIFYIQKYNSCIYLENSNGYNMTFGGEDNVHLCGENNGMAKMTEEAIWDIRERYNNKEFKQVVYKDYNKRISINTFSDIWTGKTWKHVHYDVYTEENKKYHKCNFDRTGSCKACQKLSDEEILEIRNIQNDGLTRSEVFKSLKSNISINTFNDIWYGKTFVNIQSNKENKQIKHKKYNEQDGTKNSSSKLNEEEVLDIRTKKKNNLRFKDVYKDYSDKITKSCFSNAWTGKTYKNIIVD
jgi:group I intron endonuclease